MTEIATQRLNFLNEDFAFYADIDNPEMQAWLNKRPFDDIPAHRIYLCYQANDARAILRKILERRPKAIVFCGHDASLERFINHYRSLAPNPLHQLPFALLPVGKSLFSERYHFDLPQQKLSQLHKISFSKHKLRLLEINAKLALYLQLGLRPTRLNPFKALSDSFAELKVPAPLSAMIPKSYQTTAYNEAPTAYETLDDGKIHRIYQKDQILFNKKILNLFAFPINTQHYEHHNDALQHYFKLECTTLSPFLAFKHPFSLLRQNFLCQRLQLKFQSETLFSSASSLQEGQKSCSISLSSRDFSFLMPRALNDF